MNRMNRIVAPRDVQARRPIGELLKRRASSVDVSGMRLNIRALLYNLSQLS